MITLVILGCITCPNGSNKNTSGIANNTFPAGKGLCKDGSYCAVHDILLKTGYKDDEGAENEVSFFHFLTDSRFLTVTPQSVHRADGIE